MLLETVLRHRATISRYLERYVNDGSPSGFSEINSTSPGTSPFGLTPYFNLARIKSDTTRHFGDISRAPDLLDEIESDEIFVHPDMVDLLTACGQITTESHIRVSPTASGRTVQMCDSEYNDYLKLHYAGVLGRITRELTHAKAISGLETSLLIEEALANDELPVALHLLPETYARVVTIQESDWGMVYRSSKPVGALAEKLDFLVPCFALFSADRLSVHHPTLMFQVMMDCGANKKNYFIDKFLTPILESYFSLIVNLGLQAEWNAQNLLFGFSNDLQTVVPIMRDLESVDKDITVMERLGLNVDFDSRPYKCIEESQYNYQIKHSFMFDFKLGETVLRPLISAAAPAIGVTYEELANIAKELSLLFLNKLPKNFFPNERWYSFDKVLVDQSKAERPYLEHCGTTFR